MYGNGYKPISVANSGAGLARYDTFDDFIFGSSMEENEDGSFFFESGRILMRLDPQKYAGVMLNPDYSGDEDILLSWDEQKIKMLPEIMPDGLGVNLVPDIASMQEKEDGAFEASDDDLPVKMTLNIPAGYFRVDYRTVETDAIPYDEDELSDMEVAGAWHVAGTDWKGPGMFSVHDDDLIDKYISGSAASSWITGGYESLLYPLMESLGMRASLAVEGQRCGMTANPPKLNLNGRVALRLQDEKGWELMAHSMTARYDYANYYVESLDSDLARTILAKGKFAGIGNNNTTSVYDVSTQRQYSVNSDLSGWEETPKQYIKCYIRDYNTGKLKMYNPAFPIDYQWGEMARLAPEFGFKMTSWVTPAETSCHVNVPLINEIFPNGFANYEENACNLPPLRSGVTRLPMEGLWLPGYKGETDTDNTYNKAHFEYFKAKIDEAADKGGWIIFALHAYRPCWVNSLPGALVSEGGTYPDEWVIPGRMVNDYPDTYLDAPVEKGIAQWSDWTPCPGTRLYMLWELLRYAAQRGLVNVTSSEGFERMGNRVNIGYYDGGSFLVNDGLKISGTSDRYQHYVVGVSGEQSYFRPAISAEIKLELQANLTDLLNPYLHTTDGVYSIDGLRYDVTSLRQLPKGVWIINGRKVIR